MSPSTIAGITCRGEYETWHGDSYALPCYPQCGDFLHKSMIFLWRSVDQKLNSRARITACVRDEVAEDRCCETPMRQLIAYDYAASLKALN
jgi:hypothetical protein